MGAGAGVFGPYKHGDRFRVVTRAVAGGEASYSSFQSEKLAQAFVEVVKAEFDKSTRTVGEAIDAYLTCLKDDKGNKADSLTVTAIRLRQFFGSHLDDALEVLTPPTCRKLYAKLRETKRTKSGPNKTRVETDEFLSVDTCNNTLLEGRSFAKWCLEEKKWLRNGNPLAGIKGKGKRKHGKPQLRFDDARTWTAKAMELAEKGDDGALAALMTLFMANRASEITKRKVDDVDNNGTILWITAAKTEESNGALPIPDDLQPLLRRRVEGRERGEYIFLAAPAPNGKQRPHWRNWPRANVKRICKLAGVPVVCAHAMRGLHSTLAYERGTVGNLVAESMRHRDESITKESYAKPAAVRKGQQQRALKALAGGKK